MKKLLRKVLVVICSLAFMVTGITYTPMTTAKADTTEYEITAPRGGPEASGTLEKWDYVVLPHYGDSQWAVAASVQNYDDIKGFIFRQKTYCWNADAPSWLKTHDLKEEFDLEPGETYNMALKIKPSDYYTSSKTSNLGILTEGAHADLSEKIKLNKKSGEQEVTAEIIPQAAKDLKLVLAYGQGGDAQVGGFEITDISFTKIDSFKPCIMNDDPNDPNYGTFVPEGTPWSVKTQYNGEDLWGKMSYKIDGTASDIASTSLREDIPAHDDSNEVLKSDALKAKKRAQYKDMSDEQFNEWWNEYNAIEDADAWWWWNSAKLSGYLEDVGLRDGKFYKGTMKVEYTSASTEYSPKLRTIFGGTTMINDINDGLNTIEIEQFLYDENQSDIEFNLDLLEKSGVMRVTEINIEPVDDFMPMDKNVKFKTDADSPWTFEIQNQAPSTWGAMSYIQDTPASDPATTRFRVDSPAHDDSNEILKSDDLKAKKRKQEPYKDMTDEQFNEWWNDYNALEDADAWWWWNAAKLPNYLKDVANLQEGYKYKGTIVFNYTRPTVKSSADEYDTPKLRMIENGNISVIDLVEGENTINIGGEEGFTYTGQYPSIEFNLDLLDKGGILQASRISFVRADNFSPVTPNVKDGFVPEGTPWNIKVQYDKDAGLWGQMSYAVDGTPSLVSSTIMRNDNPAHDDSNEVLKSDALKAKKRTQYKDMSDEEFDEWWANYDATEDADAWWWWNSASLPNYLSNQLSDGRAYSGSMIVNYTAPTTSTEEYTPKLRYILNGEVHIVTLEPGDNTIAIDSFDYSDVYPSIEFNLDTLEKNSLFQVKSISLTQAPGNWMRVTDNIDPGVTIPVTYPSTLATSGEVTHNWKLFAGMWEGHGAALYYDNDLDDPSDPLKVKIGAGERWDPACAQIKINNEDAYQELEEYTNYYMTYSFTSTEKGTLHISQEGYAPSKLQRVDITDDMYDESDGLYHVEFKKIFTYLPDQNDSYLTMFLTPTTYVYNEQTGETDVEMDGEYLPAGTIIANHKISFTRQDKDGWTLVTDSRDPDHQNYDDIVKDSEQNPILEAYTNSFGYNQALWSEYDNGRMSYLANQNPDGVDDIAKMGIRLDSTAYSNGPDNYSFDNQWANHLRIPNDYFYSRPDTNGNQLEDGKEYKLRFYINSTEATAENMGLIMVRQGYDSNQWFRYPVGEGLNLLNGTLQAKKSGRDTDPYIVNSDYKKTGGIDFVYNSSYTTDEDFVQFDFSEFPQGTTINDISWEFEAVGYNVFLDGSKTPDNADPIVEGETYTFPTVEGVIGYQDSYDDSKIYRPGEQVPYDDFTDDIYATSITGYKVTVVDTNGNTLKTDYLNPGESYTFPSDLPNVQDYTYNGHTYQKGETMGPVNEDRTVVANPVPGSTHTITIVNSKDPSDVLLTTSVDNGSNYELPTIPGIDLDKYVWSNKDYQPGQKIGPITRDEVVQAVLVSYYKISIDGIKVADIRDGGNYTFPSGQTASKIGYISVDGGLVLDPGSTVGPIHEDRDYLSVDEIELNCQPGASMLLSQAEKNSRGIVFGTEFSIYDMNGNIISFKNYKQVYKSESFKVGTLVTTEDLYYNYFDETIDLAQVQKAQKDGHLEYIRNIMNNNTFRNENDPKNDYATFRAGLASLNDPNIPRNFIARAYGYVETASGNVTDVTYTNNSDVRSIKTIATNIMKDANWKSIYPDAWKQEIIEYCAAFED